MAVTQEVHIYNMALNAIGTRDDVTATTERSREAEVCRLWFGPVRDHVLRAAYWPSAKAFARLALLSERDDSAAWATGDPEPGFRFAYAQPADAIRPRYLTSYSRFSTGIHAGQKAIFAQEEAALMAYTKSETNVGLWDVSLQFAIAHALGAFIAMPLHGKASRAKKAEDTANGLITEARVMAANEEENQFDSVPDWISARGYSGSVTVSRYIYPYGPMINVAEMSAVS